MGKKFLPLPTVLNGHVIVDVRDMSEFVSKEHSLLAAFVDCFEQLEKKNGKFSDDLRSQITEDLLGLKFKDMGMNAIRLSLGGDEHRTDFFADYQVDEGMVEMVGPFYTLHGCAHTKNAVVFARHLDQTLTETEKNERELTDFEVEMVAAARHFVSCVTQPEHRCSKEG